MANVFKKKSLQQQETEDVIVAQNAEIDPETAFKKASQKRKRHAIFGLVGLIIVESLAITGFSENVDYDELQVRTARETEIRRTGQIQLTEGIYQGATDFGYFQGKGKFLFSTGSEYDGEWTSNQMEGNGTLEVPVEGVYEGAFKNSKKNGQGTFSWNDGTVYTGEWKDDQMCGQGEYTTPEHVVYSGTFQDNSLQEGTCDFTNSTGTYSIAYKNGMVDHASIQYADGATYDGECNNEGLNGNGTMKFVNGDVYKGIFQNDFRVRAGTYTWKNGDVYNGSWLDDQMSGTGTYTYANGSYVKGTFSKNMFIKGSYHVENDFGTYEFTVTDGRPTQVEMTLKNGTIYNGEMTNEKLTGKAQIQYSNGDQYNGNVANGQKSGGGTYTWNDGASYEGAWENDQMSGDGVYYYSTDEDGYKLEGTFKEGKPSGECQYYTDSTTKYKTDWSDGKCVKIYE